MSVSTPRAKPSPPAEQSDRHGAIPTLNDGDRLTRDEFERRYDAMSNLSKAELIEGVVHVPSPVRQRRHSGPHFNLIGWLFNYRARTPGLEGGDNPSVRLDLGNMPQPDCLLFISHECGGQAKVDEDHSLRPSTSSCVAARQSLMELSRLPEARTCFIGGERQGDDVAGVTPERGRELAAGHVPDLDHVVPAPREQRLAVAAEDQRRDLVGMSRKDQHPPPARDVPERDRAIDDARGQHPAVA